MTAELSSPYAVPLPETEAGSGRSPEGRARRFLLGAPGDPRWVRPTLCGVLGLATLLYVWNLSAVGNANSYYAAAVLSGTKSWKAFFFGSVDAGSFVTVDKPPVALWVMGLSARLFGGYSTWSMMLPQAAAGVATIGVLYTTVRRGFTGLLGASGAAAAGLVAGLVVALTPITVAINRDNNPDTMLVLLLVLGAWALQQAVRQNRLRWLLLSCVFIGFAFNTKMLQAFLVLPALTLVYLICAKPRLLRRIWHLLAAGAVLAVSAAWWMVLVDLIPASSRPFVGSSTKNSVWDLVIGYNGLGRVLGNSGPGGAARHTMGGSAGEVGRQFGLGASFSGRGPNFGGTSGADRLFSTTLGGQISWLIPFSIVALVVGLILIRRRPRTDLARAGLLLWAGWLAVHYLVFSFSKGTFHPYYTTTMAPAIGALAGGGGVLMFRASRRWAWALPLALAITGAWAFTILRRTPSWHPWLAWTVLGITLLGAVGLLVAGLAPRARQRLAMGAVALGLVGALAGPAAYAITPLSGSGSGLGRVSPLAGPVRAESFRALLGGSHPGGPGSGPIPSGQLPGGRLPGGRLPGGWLPDGQTLSGQRPGGAAGQPAGAGMGDRPAGEIDPVMVDYLVRNQSGATWLVAVSSARSAASIILKTGRPVMAMGGFSGRDPAMSVPKLRDYIGQGRLRYVITGGGQGFGTGNSQVTQWVQKNCRTVSASEYGGPSSTSSTYGPWSTSSTYGPSSTSSTYGPSGTYGLPGTGSNGTRLYRCG